MITQETLGRAAVLVLVLGAVWFAVSQGIKQYGRAEVQQDRAVQTQVVVKAVQKHTVANTIADAKQTQGRAVLVAPVRVAVAKLREKPYEAPEAVRAGAPAVDEWLRLFNDAGSTANTAIRSDQGLP